MGFCVDLRLKSNDFLLPFKIRCITLQVVEVYAFLLLSGLQVQDLERLFGENAGAGNCAEGGCIAMLSGHLLGQ